MKNKDTKGKEIIKKESTATVKTKTDVVNVTAAAQKIQYERILKWKYPEDCTSAKDRKVFRQKQRAHIRQGQSQALKLTGKELEAKLKEVEKLRKEVLADANATV